MTYFIGLIMLIGTKLILKKLKKIVDDAPNAATTANLIKLSGIVLTMLALWVSLIYVMGQGIQHISYQQVREAPQQYGPLIRTLETNNE